MEMQIPVCQFKLGQAKSANMAFYVSHENIRYYI